MGDTTASAEAKEKSTTKGRSPSSKKQVTDASLNMDELREIAGLVDEHCFTDFEFENENIRVRLSKQVNAPAQQMYLPAPAAAAQTLPASFSEPAVSVAIPSVEEELFKISSPIVGTFYQSSSPDKAPYVSEGSMVTPESVVCIVEAMKLMNEIQAETTGEIVKIYVENGQPVEYGQPLFGIKK